MALSHFAANHFAALHFLPIWRDRAVLDITDTDILHKPVNCALAGEQRIKGRGREWEVRARNQKEVTTGTRSGPMKLGGQSGYTVKTGPRGYE